MKIDIGNIIIGAGLVWVAKKALSFSTDRISKLLVYEILKTKFQKVKLDEVIIRSEIAITNKSTFNLKVDGFRGSLYYKDLEISKIAVFNAFLLDSNKTMQINLHFGFQPGTLLQQIAVLIASGKIFGNFRVIGTLFTDQIDIPIAFTPDILPN